MTDVMLPILSHEPSLSPRLAVALAIVVTTIMLLGILGLGHLILLKTDSSAPSSTPQTPQDQIIALGLQTGCGLAAMAFLIWGIGSLGFLNLIPFMILFLASLSIPGLSRTIFRGISAAKNRPQPTLNYLLFTVLIMIAGATMLSTLYPHSHGDPLYYHLSAAWIWSRTGSIQFIDWMPWYLQGGLAEYLYTGIASGSRERMVLLLAGQMLHAAVGYGGSVALCVALAHKMLRDTSVPLRFDDNLNKSIENPFDEKFISGLAILAGTAMACFPSELFMLTHAKNDGFVLFFGLLAINLCLAREVFFRAMGYLACGVAVACKSTAIFFVIPFYAVNLVTEWQNTRSRQIWFAALGGILIASTVLLRNYFYTGSPFFPAMTGIFPSPLVDAAIAQIVAGFTRVPGTVWEIFMTQGQRFLWAMPFFLFSIWGILTGFRNPEVRRIALIHLGSLAIYIAVSGQGNTARFLFVIFGTGAGLSVVGLSDIMKRLARRKTKEKHLLAIILAVFLLTILPASNAEVPFVHLKSRVADFMTSDGSAIEWFSARKPSLKMYSWINQNLKPENSPVKILSFYENENLFLDFPVSVPENEIRASAVKQADNYEDATSNTCAGGFTHLLIGQDFQDNYIGVLTEDQRFNADFPVIHEEGSYILRRASKC